MSTLPVIVAAYLLLALEVALRQPLTLGASGIAPHLVIVLVVFVAMWGQGLGVYWTALACGLGVDLLWTRAVAPAGVGVGPVTGVVVLLGPHAVAYVLAANVVLTLRGVMMRRSPLTLPVLSVLAAGLSGLLVVFLLTVRAALDPDLSVSTLREAGAALGSAAYTGLAAGVLQFPLRWGQGLMGLEDSGARRFSR